MDDQMKTEHAQNKLLTRESGAQQERFQRLYGPGDYKNAVKKNLKRTKQSALSFLLLMILTILLQAAFSGSSKEGVTYDKYGNIVSIQRPKTGAQSVVINANVVSENGDKISDSPVKLIVASSQNQGSDRGSDDQAFLLNPDDVLEHEIRKTVYGLNEDPSQKTIAMPTALPDGTKIRWQPKASGNGVIFVLIAFLGLAYLYKNKDAQLEKAEKDARDSVLRELPDFVNKLVLLLNAGLVFNHAFVKIVDDHDRLRGCEGSYFYSQLMNIMVKCRETNGTLQHEIRMFAVRTGIVEFMRLSNIINDSMTKGSNLMKQLRMEGDSLWSARRKQMEEKGKIAETKLTFPLVLLLLVLVMITVAPALMVM